MANVQKMRYNSFELSLIKATFAEQEEALVLIRKFFLQGQMSLDEMQLLSKFSTNPNVVAILKKALSPEIEKLAARFQTVDLFSNIDLSPTPIDHALLIIESRWVAKKYLDEMFDKFVKGEDVGASIVFDDMTKVKKAKKDTYINFLARNFLLTHIDTQLFNSLLVLAGTPDETPEEQQNRLQKDSSK